MTWPACFTRGTCPEQADVTLNQTIITMDGITGYWRRYRTVDSTLTFNSTRTVIVLPTTPYAANQVHVYVDNLRMLDGYTLSGQVITFTAAVPTNKEVTVEYLSTTPGAVTGFSPGDIILWSSGVTVPDGWLQFTGQNVSRTTYAALFAVIGTTFGVGDGSTTFTLPTQAQIFTAGASGVGIIKT